MKITCLNCGYERKIDYEPLRYEDYKCLNCDSDDLKIVKPEPLGDNFPHISPLYKDLEERKNFTFPKITEQEIKDWIIDLNIKRVSELLDKGV